jgi:hypothetical protein
MILLGQHVKLDSLGITSSWSPLYASSGTPIWALYNKRSFQLYILTGAKDKIPAVSQGISPLPTHEPSVQFYQSPLETTQVNP